MLCAYLRMPYEPDPGQDAPAPERLAFQAISEVHHTVIWVITAHLKNDAASSWQGLNFNFRGVVFDGGDFNDAQFSGGEVSFNDAVFSGGTVHFGLARFSGGTVTFRGAKFSGGTVNFIHVVDWSFPPVFPWTDTPLSGVVLLRKKDQSQAWRPNAVGGPRRGR